MAQMQQSQQNAMMKPGGNAMERSGSQMDGMSGPRSGSPGSGEAPSPKRQRLDGNMQQMNQGRPGPQGPMPSNQVGHPSNPNPSNPELQMPDPAVLQQTEELLKQKGIDLATMHPQTVIQLAMQPANHRNKSVETYSKSVQQSMQGQMPKMAVNPAQMVGAQGSPLPAEMAMTPDFYRAQQSGNMGGPNNNQNPNMAAAAAGQNGNSGNHALQDYQMQLMLLEQQNKKRLLMARQEQDSMANPGMGPGPGNFGGMSPNSQGRIGDPSPNAGDMRGTPKMHKGMSPNGDMTGRGSPQPGMMPEQQLRAQMMAGGQMMNGNMMRPPQTSNPNMQGPPMTPDQMAMMRNNPAMQNGFQPGMMGQPGPMNPNMTPRTQPMGPPPAPAAGTQPSSPSAAPAPPTPSQTKQTKAAGKKADGKKVDFDDIHVLRRQANIIQGNKKGGTTGATPASEAEAPPTPTPATPITPMNVNSFNKNQQLQNGQPPNAQAQPGQPQPNQQNQSQPGAVQAPPDMPPFGNLDDNFSNINMDFANLEGGDVLDNFDFDSFLNTGADDGGLGFDANFAFGDGLEAGGDLSGMN
jgi:hypothetical protein